MLSALLAVSWEPEIRGWIIVIISVAVLMGSTYLILGTNLGARLGFLVAITALAGWMMSMAIIWAVYGIGLKGPEPTWHPSEPITIVRDGALLNRTEIVEGASDLTGLSPAVAAKKISDQLVSEGWESLEESDPQRGQAVASADEIILIEAKEFAAGEFVAVAVYDKGGDRYPKLGDSIDFLAFKHKPRYSIVEIAPLVAQRSEPGRAPARVQIDETQPHRYVVMIRDLGAKRRPAFLIGFGSGLIFFLLVWVLHRREALLRKNLALKSAVA
ncbi:MAG: hypothetical protein CK521_06145 [Acidimicrobium sp.]|nr:hypothetical protein [Ilumatobacteraceae bacterium]PHX70865.1 MAG: hypothetical protein CK521_06145 [Acidimicrobium sp.]